MKRFLIIPLLFASTLSSGQVLEGPYVGQTPPGLTPQVFSPVQPSEKYRDWGGAYTADMNAYYFGRHDLESGQGKTMVFKKEGKRWIEMEAGDDMGANFSPDGKLMHMGSRYRESAAEGWSKVKSLGAAFEQYRIMRLTSSLSGTYVFDEIGTNGNGLLRYSRIVDGVREAPKTFGEHINTGRWTAHPFIAPDESYLIWDSEREGGYGDSDMYISFKQEDGTWGDAINFGPEINTEAEDGGGYVTPDGKYLMYCRRCAPPNFEIMWVDASIIDALRPKR